MNFNIICSYKHLEWGDQDLNKHEFQMSNKKCLISHGFLARLAGLLNI